MMLRPGFKVIMSEEVDAFLDTLQQDVRAKIIYNVDKVANGYMDKDLFKKLENTDIWEFRTLYKGIQYRLLAFWDTESGTLVVLRTDSSRRRKRRRAEKSAGRRRCGKCILNRKNRARYGACEISNTRRDQG